jgi:putative sigma-54 modulation protein
MNITAKNFELTDAIKQYIEKKFTTALEGLNGDATHVDIEVDRQTKHHKGDVFHVRGHVQVTHGDLFAEETQIDLYAAIDVCSDELQRQVRDRKGKSQAKERKARRTRRALKSMFGFWKQ